MKVSCLMVTQPGREEFALRALDDFAAQDYIDRELIVVTDDGRTLGELRNEAVERATGELCMTWDDDDRHAFNRISEQVAALEAADADVCCLSRLLLKCRCGAEVVSQPRRWECSALFRKSMAAKYPSIEVAEDAAMLKEMMAKGALVVTMDDRWLYTKTWHDDNVTPMHAVLKGAGHICGE